MGDIKSKILVVDDEPQIRKMLKVILEAEGYRFEPCEDGIQALKIANSIKPDLILLDLGLPGMDGTEVISQIRGWSNVPIIVVSARDQEEMIVKSLDLGADDYVTKPFSTELLLARIRANLRKKMKEDFGTSVLANGGIEMDLVKHEITIDGKVTGFSPKEYDLLKYFMSNLGKMLTHNQILKEVWGPAHTENSQYLRVYTGQIRQKIEKDLDNPVYIITEPGIGYRMEKIPAAKKQESATA